MLYYRQCSECSFRVYWLILLLTFLPFYIKLEYIKGLLSSSDLSENSYMAFFRICLHTRDLPKTCFPCLLLQVKVLSPPKPEPTVEDRAFLAALDKLLVDDVQTRREENPKV